MGTINLAIYKMANNKIKLIVGQINSYHHPNNKVLRFFTFIRY
ncbi:hypothetical protein VISI1226_21639, partial [Vibrio sinaloensis DSM 21326]